MLFYLLLLNKKVSTTYIYEHLVIWNHAVVPNSGNSVEKSQAREVVISGSLRGGEQCHSNADGVEVLI